MARVNVVQTNFTAGELSPRLLGRVDIARYQNAAETLENAYVLAHGGACRCPGLRYITGTKTHSKRSRAIPFVFSATQAYVLEFGDAYMRVYKDRGQVLSAPSTPYEIVSPYLEADLPDLNYVQSADTMFLVHPNYPVRKLTRSGHTAWKLVTFPFVVEPHDEVGQKPATALTLGATSGTGVTATAAAAAFQPSDVGRPLTSGDGVARIVGFTSTTVVTIDITDTFAGTVLASGAWTIEESPKATLTPSGTITLGGAATLTLGAGGWRNDVQVNDVGRYVHVNGGVVEITGYTSATVVTGIVRSALSGTTAAPADSWSLESRIWSAANGYPRAVTLFEQRLILAGTTAFPNTVWGSRTGVYDDMTPGAADDDGFSFTLVSDQQNPVQQLASIKQLIPLTYSAEWSMRGGIEKPLTPTNVQAKSETSYGVKNVRPVRVGAELLTIQRAGRKLRSLSYRADNDSYVAPDITILSEHITKGGISEMAYAQEPDSIVAMVRGDGVMPLLTLNREQEVIGWARRTTDGEIESVASIPYEDLDQLWCIVKRTIGGATKRYMELIEFQDEPDDNLQTDSCVTGTVGSPTTTWSGFDHLEGKTLDVVADGVVFPQEVVTGGQIVLPRAVSSIEAGLHYESTLTTLPPELGLPEGSAQGRPISINECTVRLYRSMGCTIEDEVIPFRRFGEAVLDSPLEPFTGDKKANLVHWEAGKKLTIRQTQPLPLCVLAIIKRVSVGD